MIGWFVVGWLCVAAVIGWLCTYTPKDSIQETLDEMNKHQRQLKALKKAVNK